jgi:small subunit ribosomal protein S6
MNRYETFIISDPDISDEKRASLFERINQLISQENGFMVAFDEWGTKKLAYEIKKKIRGHYVRLDYCGTGTLVNEIERFSRIDDRMTVLLEKEADIDRIKEEIAEAEPVTDLVEESEKNQDAESNSDPVLFDAPGSEAMEIEKVKTEKKDEEE